MSVGLTALLIGAFVASVAVGCVADPDHSAKKKKKGKGKKA